ncbi:hypothetical protein MMC25_008171 [Agyrium rufum]|nr:hypothetical protein [Agyrium rufum]
MTPMCYRFPPRRHITADEKPLPKADTPGPGPNQEQLPHVSEEAAATSEITGETGPDISQGTPVEEILKRDGEEDKAPQIIQESINATNPKGTRSFSTSTRRRAGLEVQESSLISSQPPLPPVLAVAGHKFGLPTLPIPKYSHVRHRYDDVVKQFTNLLLQDGKLGVAEKNMALILNHLRTASPPSPHTDKALIPGTPPTSHLPLDPIKYLTVAIDSIAPLLRIRSQRGAAGGGAALQIPVPLGVRQRRRQAITWILDAASKRRFAGSGRGGFAQKVAEELISIVEGKSGIWERRSALHKLAVAARASLSIRRRRR